MKEPKFILLIIFILLIGCNNYNVENDRITLAAGIRRANSNPWFIINNTKHKPLGIKNVIEDNEKITVNYSFDAKYVNSFIVTPDETLIGLGYSAGASVGLKNAYIFLYRNVNGIIIRVDPTTVNEPSGNLWIYGLFSQK